MAAVGKRCGEMYQQLQCRLDQLSLASKGCAQSAHSAEQHMRQQMQILRAAVDKREEALVAEIKQEQQVRLCCVTGCIHMQ